MDEVTRKKLDSVFVGSRIWFEGEANPYKVRARDNRYVVCTKPFNLKRTVLYCIIDLQENRRGPDNNVFCTGYETEEQIAANMARFSSGELEVSRRRGVELDVSMVCV